MDGWEISITFKLHGIRTTALSSVFVKTLEDGTVALTDTVEWSEFKTTQDRQCTYKRNTESHSCTHCCRGKAISIVIAPQLSGRHSTCAILHQYYHQWPVHFCTLSHKGMTLGGKIIEHKMCVLIFAITFVWNISHFKKNSAIYNHKRASLIR